MPAFVLDHRLVFPDPRETDENGILAIGGDLRPERLLLAYSKGIFPWYDEGLPILWHCPREREILHPAAIRVNRTTKKIVGRGHFQVRYDTAFESVIRYCASVERPGQGGTWITSDMIDAYTRLHQLGHAHCAEAWQGDQLMGGVYGIAMGGAFFGESMFSLESNASKVAFVTLVLRLNELGYTLVDCQNPNPHLVQFGTKTISRDAFLDMLPEVLAIRPSKPWPD
jgi:leucyl/phenylalanyl-tRNA--protein transferase